MWIENTERTPLLGGALEAWSTDKGQLARDPSLAERNVFVSELGLEPTDETSDRWIKQGQEAMRAVMIDFPPKGGLEPLLRFGEARLQAAEDVGRSYLLPASAIEQVTKRTYVPRRGLLRPGTQAARLAATAQETAEDVAQAAEVARQQRDPKSLRAQGYQAISRRRDMLAPMLEPFFGCHGPSHETETHVTFVFRTEPGLQCVPFDDGGWALVNADSILVLSGAVPDLDAAAAAYLRTLRRRYGSDRLDFSAVGDRWTDRGHERARALLREQAASVFVNVAPHRAWRQPFLVNLIVRGLLVHPTAFVQMAIDALDRVHDEQSKPVALPGPFDAQAQALTSFSAFFGPAPAMTDVSRVEGGRRVIDLRSPTDRERPSANPPAAEWIGALAITAAESGDVGVGELLRDDEPASPATPTKRTTKHA